MACGVWTESWKIFREFLRRWATIAECFMIMMVACLDRNNRWTTKYTSSGAPSQGEPLSSFFLPLSSYLLPPSSSSNTMRRKVGVSAVRRKKDEASQFSKVGKSLEATKLTTVQEVLTTFKENLTQFAKKHKDRINSDPEFRQQFHTMCVSVGVDPLASNKGFWSDILGVGDFYFELGYIVLCVVYSYSLLIDTIVISVQLSLLQYYW